jgi:hypothetical protein
MKKSFFFLLILLSASLFAQKTTLSVFGTVHLHNPGNDKINADLGDINSPKRQAELRETIELVSRFQPTKIAFEWIKGDTLWSKYYYQAWLSGTLESVIAPDDEFYLNSELVQLVYPLGKAAGLTELHPVDAFTTFPADSAMSWALANGQEAEVASLQQLFTNGQRIADSLAAMPIPDMLRTCNSDYFAHHLNQSIYLKHFIGLGKGKDYPGTFLVEEWYARNLRIFTNIHRVVEPHDRVLIIFGAGHKEILDDLIRDRVDWEWVDSGTLLDKE